MDIVVFEQYIYSEKFVFQIHRPASRSKLNANYYVHGV
jgi:hypothetical protein